MSRSGDVGRNARVIAEFRANGGRVGGEFSGTPVLLLHTCEIHSGQPCVHPLTYWESEGRWVVFASNSGADDDPGWYRNLAADPSVSIEVGTDTLPVAARTLAGAERQAISAELIRLVPRFEEYQQATARVIPVVLLERR